MSITSLTTTLLVALIFSLGCAGRDAVRAKDFLDPLNRGLVVVYEDGNENNFADEMKAAKLADEYRVRGSMARVQRVPTEVEFELIRSAILSCGSEMNDDEIAKLFFLKTSAGLTIQPKDTPPFTLTGKSTGYRIIYGPNPSSVHVFGAQGEDYNFQKNLDEAIPACLVVEEVIGLGKGHAITLRTSKYFKITK